MFIIPIPMKKREVSESGSDMLKDRLLALRLNGEEVEELDTFCRRHKISRSRAIREAIFTTIEGGQ